MYMHGHLGVEHSSRWIYVSIITLILGFEVPNMLSSVLLPQD